ncbi:unnamed protein product [Paramecium primaurelia]|uniref:Uncharacterized protein n=1 Tax=Paramecium primaurelia TaxID=5886 RepID=A0A8S1MM94_PARPR|nr:unnamed protein product [Paramecium primaurelia]
MRFSHIVAGSIQAYHFDQHLLRTKQIIIIQFEFKLELLAFWTTRLAYFLFNYRILRGFRDPRYEVIFDEYKKENFKRDVVVDNIFCKDSLYLQLVLLCISYLRINQILNLWQFQEHLLNRYILKDQLVIHIPIYYGSSIIIIQGSKNQIFKFYIQVGLWKKYRKEQTSKFIF